MAHAGVHAILSTMNRNDAVTVIAQQRPATPGPVRPHLWPYLIAAVLLHAAIAAALIHWTSSDSVQTVVMVDLIAGDSGDTASAQSAGQVLDESADAQTKRADLQIDELPPGSQQATEPTPQDGLASSLAQSSQPDALPQSDIAQPEPIQALEQDVPMDRHNDSPRQDTFNQMPPAVSAMSSLNVATAPSVAPKPGGAVADMARPVAPKTSADNAAGSRAKLPASADSGEQAGYQAQAAGLTQAAVGLHNPPPVYPARAKRQGVQGTVLLRLLIGTDGLVQKVEVVSSSRDRGLDDAAMNAVGLWRFKPAVEFGVAIDQWIEVPIVFRLK